LSLCAGALLLCLPAVAYSQNLVGMKEQTVIKHMSQNYANFTRENGIVNSSYKYFRYFTNDGLQTMLIFFDQNGVCKEVRLNFDRSMLTTRKKELDALYTKVNESEWLDKKGGRSYSITLTDDMWYYTLKYKEALK
jgi:hypothetical protein